MKRIVIMGKTIEYTDDLVTIIDSYDMRDKREITELLMLFKLKTGYKSKRSIDSWVREWVSHNRLYRLGLFRSHTKDCDLEEDIKLRVKIIYFILSL